MTRQFFVTGTNTEVGKTFVTRAIVRAYVKRGLSVRALKPVESGATLGEDGARVPEDASALMSAAMGRDSLESVCAYSFLSPVSPHLAAAREGKTIEPEPILSMLERAHRNADLVVVEGAGGLLVPLSETLLYGDLVWKAGMPIVIVAPDVLGTINAVLLTVEAARHRNIDVLGVILNRSSNVDYDNANAIARHGNVPILGCFPELKTDDVRDETLADLAEEHLDLTGLIQRS